MNPKSKFVGPTEILTSNPFGDAELRSSSNRGRPDLLAILRERIRAAIARARSSRVPG
jgi:hypothetical protein